ncbi:uncharacterized protein LOC143216881 [Lasioglossum baleicum]|uniref:uncharacterized protein LOC143216881 n=1 Tax=Lasioglossum baleicum TaxID=434251 RepID=UPI003FCD5D22
MDRSGDHLEYKSRFCRRRALVSHRSDRFRNDTLDMAIRLTVLATLLMACVCLAFPQKDGQIFSNEAIKQAQNTYLIPKDATIQKVQEGIELAAYESIPGDQKINLFEILGEHVPPEVVNNLQAQIDQIGRP